MVDATIRSALLMCLVSTTLWAAPPPANVDPNVAIRVYYSCGLANYGGGGQFIEEDDEERASAFLLNKFCSKEYEALKEAVTQSRLAHPFSDSIGSRPEFSLSATLAGHQAYAADELRLLIRADRLAECWSLKSAEYVRGTNESAESILDASLLSCSHQREQLMEMTKRVYPTEAAEGQFNRGLQLVRQRVSKSILDARLKGGTNK